MKICLFFSWLCFALSFVFAGGKRCFQCQDLPHPSDCRQIAYCPDTDECFVDEFITGGGTVLYDTGCRPRQRCHGAGRRDIVARADIVTCSECCVRELCNLQGCGQSAPSRNTRGPYCFACAAQTGQNNCRNVKMCTTDQVCLIGYSETDQFYSTSCITKTQCAALQTHVHPVVPVGKRNSITFTKCSTCCTDDFCNNNCTHVVLPVDGQWSNWSPWTTCSATCGHGIKIRSRTCDNPQPQNNGRVCTGDHTMFTSCSAIKSCPVSMCNYKGQMYTEGQLWHDGCEYNCTCVNAALGYYRCNDLCPVYTGMPPSCHMITKPGECCAQPDCSPQTTAVTDPIPTTRKPSVCNYHGVHYTKGQTWNDGCTSACTCVDASVGLYSCHQQCLDWNRLPSTCHLEDAPPGLCCKQPKCPPNIRITIKKGYEMQYPGYTYL